MHFVFEVDDEILKAIWDINDRKIHKKYDTRVSCEEKLLDSS